MRISAKEKKMKTKRFLSIGAAFMVKAAVLAVLLTFALVLAACGSLGDMFGGSSANTGGRVENSLYTFSRGTDQYQVRFTNDEFVIVRYQGKSETVVIPAGFDGVPVVAIEWAAFEGHTEITSIAIPASVIRIGPENINGTEVAFDGCTGLTGITVAEENEIYSSEDGVLFNKDKTTLLLCPEGKSGNYTVPASVTALAGYAFDKCERLTGVTIPDSVTSIGEMAFGSTGLTSITIPDGVTSTGVNTFFGCTGLTSVIISESVTSIGDGAFWKCTGLTSITIPDSVTSIGSSAFAETGLTAITIPDSVTSIGALAFAETGLTSIIIPDSVTYIGGNAFQFCTRLTSVTISPVKGRKWDDTISGDSGFFSFGDCPKLNDASKTALRNAGYTGSF
jgi:hypothetical protein